MDYKSFEAYYANPMGFALDMNNMLASYCELVGGEESLKFLGFGVDHLKSYDTIIMNKISERLVMPSEENAVYFLFGIWVMTSADLFVYNHLNDDIKKWQAMTQYPKFTGWNYYATHPKTICRILLKRYSDTVENDFYTFFSSCKNRMTEDIIKDICMMLSLDRIATGIDAHSFFEKLWIDKSDSRDYEEPFSLECFRDSRMYF